MDREQYDVNRKMYEGEKKTGAASYVRIKK